jgi:transcriptional regulator with XRE-family HTH domain
MTRKAAAIPGLRRSSSRDLIANHALGGSSDWPVCKPGGGQAGGHEAAQAIGEVICELRSALGWSQGRLAAELGRISAHPTVTREMVSRWEHGKREPGPFWLRHIAVALQVPQWELEGGLRRRDVLMLAGAASGGLIPGTASCKAGLEMFTSVAAGDPGSLESMQTSHQMDLMLAGLAAADRPVLLRLARWADDGGSDVLRVNAAGILAKTTQLDYAGLATAALRRDREVRLRYLRAVAARVGTGTRRLAAELRNPADAGARWCSAYLLAADGSDHARRALAGALRSEPVTEVVRTVGLLLHGDDPCT